MDKSIGNTVSLFFVYYRGIILCYYYAIHNGIKLLEYGRLIESTQS